MDATSTTPPAVGVAWGLDLAAPALLVAQRGFSGLVCNEMADLARWRRSGGAAVLLVADHVVETLIDREHLSGAPVSIGVAVPGWFGAIERHHLIDRLTHGSSPEVAVTLLSAPLCLAMGSNRAAVHAGSAPAHEVVLAIDAEIGWSAAVVRVSDDEVRELAGIAVEPGLPVERARLLRSLLDAASVSLGAQGIGRVVVIGGVDEAELLKGPVAEVLGGAEAPRIGVVATRRTTSGGAMVLADPAADLRAGGTLLPGWVPSTGAAWHVVQAIPRALGASTDRHVNGDEVAVVLGSGEPTPAIAADLLDAGWDESTDLVVDVVEAGSAAPPPRRDDAVAVRRVLTAHLLQRPQRDAARADVALTIEVDPRGNLCVGPTSIWQLSWAPSVTVAPMPRGDGMEPTLLAAPVPSDTERSDTGPGDAATAVAVASAIVAVAVAGLIGSSAGIDPGPHGSPTPSADDGSLLVGPPAATDGALLPIEPVEPVEPDGVPDGAPDGAPSVRRSNPGALAELLQRCERLLSCEVGAPVAVRSVPALLGCFDGAGDDELRASAARLRALGERRGDELGEVLVAAVDESLRCLADDPAHRYMAGTLADVAAEVAQVVEHLRVVVGIVAPAERRRLVHDAVLLGPELAVAVDVVDRVLDSVGDARHDPLPGSVALDAARWLILAVSSPPDDRFVLADPMPSDSMPSDSIAIRVVLEN